MMLFLLQRARPDSVPEMGQEGSESRTLVRPAQAETHTHNRLTAVGSGLPG